MTAKQLRTWKEIAKLFGVCVATMIKHRPELEAGGWIFYTYEGWPPHKVVHGFDTELLKWQSIKASRGEMLSPKSDKKIYYKISNTYKKNDIS